MENVTPEVIGEHITEPETIKPILVGSVVLYKGNWFRVRKCTKNTVNLGSVFGKSLYHKGILKDEVVEDETNWYSHWTKSETYQSM